MRKAVLVLLIAVLLYGSTAAAHGVGTPYARGLLPVPDALAEILRDLWLSVQPEPEPDPFIIVIDAGHGGKDSGATAKLRGTRCRESDVNLALALSVAEGLEAHGVTVILTRDDDRTLPKEARPQMAIDHAADLYLSIHHNASTSSSPRGSSVYYRDARDGADLADVKRYARYLLDSLTESLGTRDMGVHSGNAYSMSTLDMDMPAVIVEIGFMTHPDELSRIVTDEFRTAAANALVEATLRMRDDLSQTE